jgi:hypothetical protein
MLSPRPRIRLFMLFVPLFPLPPPAHCPSPPALSQREREQSPVEGLRSNVARVIALPILWITAIHWIVLKMSWGYGVVRLIMRR